MAGIRTGLAPLTVEIAPLSASQPRVLILKLPGSLMTADTSVAFDLAHQLNDQFNLENAEPEIFTDLVPEPDPRRQGRREESVNNFPPGCWVAEDPEPDQKPDWALQAMRVRNAWQFSSSTGHAACDLDILVAQPDTGVTQHPELAGVASVPGYDFVDDREGNIDPLDYIGNPGHGTATASVLISGSAGKVTGVALKARHMPIRAIESVFRVTQLSVAVAIEFAIQNGAHVITMSLGGVPSFALWFALRRAVKQNLIVLAAAGNCVGEVVFRGMFVKADFSYVAAEDVYICPAGERLKFYFSTQERGLTLRRYWTNACAACAIKARCTSGVQRRITRWEHEHVLEAVQQRLDENPEKMRVRRETSEHPFGTLKSPVPMACAPDHVVSWAQRQLNFGSGLQKRRSTCRELVLHNSG
jgi:subtilase family protein/DDE family transposase